MSVANDLIERMEAETGQRIDDDDNTMAIAGLMGALARMMGQSPDAYTERDDVAAGMIIQHQMSPEGQREQQAKEMMADMLASGMSPDDLAALMG